MLSGSLPPRTERTWGPVAVPYLALWGSKSQRAFCFVGVHPEFRGAPRGHARTSKPAITRRAVAWPPRVRGFT
jgi:hypothetical protein